MAKAPDYVSFGYKGSVDYEKIFTEKQKLDLSFGETGRKTTEYIVTHVSSYALYLERIEVYWGKEEAKKEAKKKK